MDLTLILTEDCNLRCTYCYQKTFRPTAMPAEVGVAAVSAALDHGADHLALTFFGGEPLLQAETLFTVLAAARTLARQRSVGLTAKVPTNGLLLTEEVIDRAGQHGLFVSLSFDGVRPAQDAGRVSLDGQSSFLQAQRALRLLVAAGRPFAVYSVITPANVRHLAASRRYLWDEGARLLVSALDYTADWGADALAELVQQYHELGKFYEQMLGRKRYFHMEPFDSRISLRTRAGDFKDCCPGIRQVTVGPDGTLYGCVEYFYRRQLPLGTVETWLDESQVKALAKARAGTPAECQGCGVRDRCTSHCDCVNLRTTGVANRPALSTCLTEQATLRSVDAVGARLFRRRLPEFLSRHYATSYHLLTAVERLLEELGVGDERAATC